MPPLTVINDTGNQASSPDFNFLPIKQIDFSSEPEKRAFARFLQLREALSGSSARPVTINDIIRTANLYQLRSEDGETCKMSPFDTTVRQTKDGLRVMLSRYSGEELRPGDRIYMFVSPDADKIDSVLDPRPLKLICPVQSNVCAALRRIGVGADYNFTGAPESFGVNPEKFIFGNCEKTVCFSIISGDITLLPGFDTAIASSGGSYMQVGTVTRGESINIACGGEYYSLQPLAPARVLGELSAVLRPCSYNPGMPAPKKPSLITESRRLMSVSNLEFGGSSPFHDGFYSVASLITRLLCAGVPPKNCSFTLNTKRIAQESVSDAVSFTLGVFTAMLDAGITLRLCSDFTSEQNYAVCSAFYGEQPFAEKMVSGGKYLYRLTPRYDEYGLPDKEEFDKLLCYVGYLFRKKLAVSASITPPYESGEHKINEDVSDAERRSALPCSVYVSTEAPIEARLLGKR